MRLKILLVLAVIGIFACKRSDERLSSEVEKQMKQYFTDNNLGSPKSTADGLMYVITLPGEGIAPKKGDIVTVNYKGKLLNGQEFDSTFGTTSGPLTYTVGKVVPGLKESVMIPGFDEAVLMLKQGGTGTFVMPPYLGYQAKTVNNPDGTLLIPPNSPLAFEIQILEVRSSAPAK